MPEDSPPAPALPTPAPAPRLGHPSVRRVPVRPQPSPSGPLAGNPITTSRRSLPPGIPAGMADLINTPQEIPAPVVIRHPSFAPLSAQQQTVKATAARLRGQLITAVAQAEGTLKVIDEAKAVLQGVDAELLKAEGIDLDRVEKFRDGIASTLALTQ